MKNFVLFVFSVLVAIFHLSAAGVFFSSQRVPDLALAFVVALVLAQGFKSSWKWILVLGIFIDAGSSTVFGMTALAFFLVGWIVSRLAKVADIRSRKSFFVASLAAIAVFSEIVKDLFVLAELKIKANYLHKSFGVPLDIFSLDYLLKLAYTAIAACAIYYIFRRVSRRLFLEPIRLAKKY